MSDGICLDDIVYEGDEALTLEFTCVECIDGVPTAINITGATVVIAYKNPTGTGQYLTTITDAVGGVVEFSFSDGSGITPSGKWTLWPVITFADNRHTTGSAYELTVKKPGT